MTANPYFSPPTACRRILILSNLQQGFRLPRLEHGDVIVHLNRALHFEEAWRRGIVLSNVLHVLFVAPRWAGREHIGLWHWPEKLHGFHGVYTLRGEQYRGLPWFADYAAAGGSSPSAGFAVANLLRAWHPQLPILLVGFAPDRPGTGRWPCYQWGVEAAWYAAGRGDFRLLAPEDPPASPAPEPPRLRLVITSCRHYRAFRDAQRATWLAQLPGWISYNYYIGGDPPPDAGEEPDVVYLPGVPDTYLGLPAKVKAAMAHAAAQSDWDWLGKLDDDAFLVPARLAPRLQAPAVFLGRGVRGQSARGGPGYFFTRAVAEDLLAHASEIPDEGAEDELITAKIMALGHPLTDCLDIHAFAAEEGVPAPDNDAIAASQLDADAMRKICMPS